LAKTRSHNIVDEILEGWRRGTRGPLPQIDHNQLLNALVLIEREGPLGRRALAQAIQIKDGVARGLMERLAESRIASVTENGVQLSKPGRERLHKFLRRLSIRKILPLPESDLIVDSEAMSVHLRGAYNRGMTGVPQRDEAIKAGADGSITVAVLGRKLVIPPDNKDLADLAPRENARLRSELEPSNKDLIIIGFGKDASRALAGALAAVLSLQK
jgi:hypothetical protein